MSGQRCDENEGRHDAAPTCDPALNQASKRQAPQRLRNRSEFLNAAKGRRLHSQSFSLQSIARAPADAPLEQMPRFGLTVTKKIGHAVERNRIRRRLREALRLARDLPARADHDYVIVARTEALTQNFASLTQELKRALGKIDQPRPPRSEQGQKPHPRRSPTV